MSSFWYSKCISFSSFGTDVDLYLRFFFPGSMRRRVKDLSVLCWREYKGRENRHCSVRVQCFEFDKVTLCGETMFVTA
jgi:hypothetical protein